MNDICVMVVEDMPEVALDIQDCLKELGYRVLEGGASGEEAIKIAGKKRPDMVLMDIHLRGKLNGMEAAEQIHTLFDIPVVFLSAYSDNALLLQAKRTGSFGYLIKPFDECELHATLQIAIYKSNMDKERRELQEQRNAIEKAMLKNQKWESLGILAGGIAHDFNNILMTILGNADIAFRDMPADAPGRDCIKEIEKASRRAADLIGQMLAFSGRKTQAAKPVDITEIAKTTTLLLGSLGNRKVAIKMNLGKNLPRILADLAQMREILINLSLNSIEAIGNKKGGEIIISTTLEQNGKDALALNTAHVCMGGNDELTDKPCVVLTVTDNGCGMDKGALAKIFDPFFSTKITGRGLGLAAVFGIVRSHGGTIIVQSNLGNGSTFKILFPVLDEKSSSLRTNPAVKEMSYSCKGGTILVVDDESQVGNLARGIVERLGYKALLAFDGQQALEIFEKNKNEISCVLLDLTMPIMGGGETFNKLRMLQSDVKVILSSGYEEEEAIHRFGAELPTAFIQKPYCLKALREILQKVL